MTVADNEPRARKRVHPPSDGPMKRGTRIPRQGEGGYDACWYPVCLSTDVAPGQARSSPFLNGRVLVYRGASGQAYVLSPFCRHLGADLSVGQVVGENIRCAFHHWSYDGSGVCVHTAIGDAPPRDANLYRFPTHEGLGLIWAFNGDTPLYDPPAFSVPESALTMSTIHNKDIMNVDPYMVFSNSMDLQHLKVVHGIELIGELEDLQITPHTMSYHQLMKVPGMGTMPQKISIWGTNSISLEGQLMGRATYQMSVGLPLPGGNIRNFNIDATTKPGDGPGEAQMVTQLIQMMVNFGKRLIEEDAPVHDTMSFRHDKLTASDKYLNMYLRYAAAFPRSRAAEDMIGV
jgi:nitrite reductase/ring-hydroxylating ferredoxin subunit